MNEQVRVVVGSDEAIFASLYPRLRRFAAVTTPPEIDPDDLVQDALERTLRLRQLSSLNDPAAYLIRVMVNLASNHRRSLARARRMMARIAEDEGDNQSYPSDVAELLRLPVRQRAMLFMREVEGFSYSEIGQMLEMSSAAVEKASQRARARLSAAMRQEEQS